MTEPRGGYLDRLRARRLAQDVKRCTVFGLVIGWAMALFFSFQWYYTHNVSDEAMLALAWCGMAMLGLTVIAPTAMAWPEKVWMSVARRIGAVVFGAVLASVYLLLVTPMGWVTQRVRGTAPFHSWQGAPPCGVPGWTPKVPTRAGAVRDGARGAAGAGARLPLVLQPVRVVHFFVRQGQWAVVPVLVVLMTFGLLMFFVQTSSLAPFIYTLF